VERRLAAVLAADVAGYSRLMGIDEEGTLARLKAVRKALVDPTIAAHHGRIVKTTGDGMLVEFASAVDAARCSVEVQRAMVEQNATVPQDQMIQFRIGIHVGDIISDDNDIFGEGVNIAARLESIAEPGGVKLGYVALAADMFGDRRQARDLEDMRGLVGDLRNDPIKLRARGRAALAKLASQPQVDAGKLCAIGFCFGSSVVLELARDGADLKAVVSFHGQPNLVAIDPGCVKTRASRGCPELFSRLASSDRSLQCN
jgi:Dienelactone hydrolase family/Adenylate and Guanylate cyclase catalytic domain